MQFMNFIFKMSLCGSLLYLIILLFKPITKKVFSATWNYYILVAVLLIFILPLGSFIKAFEVLDYKVAVNMKSVSTLASEAANIKIDEKDIIGNTVNNSEPKSVQINNNVEAINSNEENKEEPQTFFKNYSKEMVLCILIAGIMIFATKEIIMCISFNKKLRQLSDIVKKEEINNILETCKKALNINRKITIKECSNIKSPMITGIADPVITIPQMEYNKEKLEIIFKHELIHYKRKDLWIKIIGLIINIINWFNPLVYILRNNLNIACELSLDETLVKNMDKDKRKDYAKVILELLENSKNRSLVVGTALFNDKKELENRLKKIMYFKKSRKTIMFISLLIAMMFTVASIFTSTVVFASNEAASEKFDSAPAEFAVYVGEDGLYMSDLNESDSVLIDKGKTITQPLISRDGENVAYIKDDTLHICNIETKIIEEVSKKTVESYDFDSKNDLIYSTEDTGISSYNIKSKESANLISDEYKYYNIKCDSNNKVYASKRYEYKEDDNLFSKSLGIISYNLNSKLEKTILEGKQGSDKEIEKNHTNAEIMESLGATPNIAKISTDDKYLYIWNSPNSGSTASDINQFVVYDTVNNKLIDFTGDTTNGNSQGIYGLHYDDNISQNPLDSDIVALNGGVNRNMFDNKSLDIIDIKSNNLMKLLPEDQVSMTPCYSNDGKNILYSGSKKIDNNVDSAYSEWKNQSHNIYEINTETQKITQITSGKYFDFMPKYLLNNEILFIRSEGNLFSLWKTKNGIETKLGDSLNFNGSSILNKNIYYYGHYETKFVIDVFIK